MTIRERKLMIYLSEDEKTRILQAAGKTHNTPKGQNLGTLYTRSRTNTGEHGDCRHRPATGANIRRAGDGIP